MRHYSSDRRTNFFVQNSLWIGYQAWQGYLNLDRGVLVISSSSLLWRGFANDLMDDSDRHSREVLEPSLNFRYIPQSQLAIYLQEWLVPDDSTGSILAAVADYQPAAELVFALESDSNLDIGWCQNLQVLPPVCYEQIDRRLSEFQLTT